MAKDKIYINVAGIGEKEKIRERPDTFMEHLDRMGNFAIHEWQKHLMRNMMNVGVDDRVQLGRRQQAERYPIRSGIDTIRFDSASRRSYVGMDMASKPDESFVDPRWAEEAANPLKDIASCIAGLEPVPRARPDKIEISGNFRFEMPEPCWDEDIEWKLPEAIEESVIPKVPVSDAIFNALTRPITMDIRDCGLLGKGTP